MLVIKLIIPNEVKRIFVLLFLYFNYWNASVQNEHSFPVPMVIFLTSLFAFKKLKKQLFIFNLLLGIIKILY